MEDNTMCWGYIKTLINKVKHKYFNVYEAMIGEFSGVVRVVE